MNQVCDVIFQGNAIGSAQISMQGLYYRFDCSCHFPDRAIYKLQAQCGEKITDLGVCVPIGDSFGLTKKIPVSRLGKGDITVSVKGQEAVGVEAIIPAEPDKPFERLEALDHAVLQGDGIAITNQSQDTPDSDLSPECPSISAPE